MSKQHRYEILTTWTGNLGSGTASYRGYDRAHEIHAAGKLLAVPCSSDPAFRGDPKRYNPEELFVSSLSACHMLWYLHLCADAGVVVTEYRDSAVGTMVEEADGSGAFSRVLLRPKVTITDPGRVELARGLHHKAHELCFLARSVKCEVVVEPELVAQTA